MIAFYYTSLAISTKIVLQVILLFDNNFSCKYILTIGGVYMALIRCEECGKEVSEKATSCPNCGSPISKKKFCKHCGESIDDDCVICPKCGKQVESLKNDQIIINNSASSSASSSASAASSIPKRRKKKYNILVDLILICCTGGLWIIWMLIRPKYEY